MTPRTRNFFTATLLIGMLVVPTLAQTTPGQPGQQPNPNTPPGGRQRRQYDPAQARQQALDRIKQELGASDDDFKALAPKIDKVMTLQRDVGRGSSRRSRGNRGGSTDPNSQTAAPSATSTTPLSPVRQASADLQAALANKDSKPDEIKAKLDAYRAAKAQARTDLTAAQQDLLGLLTQRQEATLVNMGILE